MPDMHWTNAATVMLDNVTYEPDHVTRTVALRVSVDSVYGQIAATASIPQGANAAAQRSLITAAVNAALVPLDGRAPHQYLNDSAVDVTFVLK